jgi:hypothetical protein
MAKQPIGRAQLIEKVIAAIRQHPGCEGVKEISISPVNVSDGEPTWNVSIIDSGTARYAAAYHAASRAKDEFEPLFHVDD